VNVAPHAAAPAPPESVHCPVFSEPPPDTLHATVPVGVTDEPEPASVTVTVQAEPWPARTGEPQASDTVDGRVAVAIDPVAVEGRWPASPG
jgi:hypothetical protein